MVKLCPSIQFSPGFNGFLGIEEERAIRLLSIVKYCVEIFN